MLKLLSEESEKVCSLKVTSAAGHRLHFCFPLHFCVQTRHVLETMQRGTLPAEFRCSPHLRTDWRLFCRCWAIFWPHIPPLTRIRILSFLRQYLRMWNSVNFFLKICTSIELGSYLQKPNGNLGRYRNYEYVTGWGSLQDFILNRSKIPFLVTLKSIRRTV